MNARVLADVILVLILAVLDAPFNRADDVSALAYRLKATLYFLPHSNFVFNALLFVQFFLSQSFLFLADFTQIGASFWHVATFLFESMLLLRRLLFARVF